MSEQSGEYAAGNPLVPAIRRAVLHWKASGGDVSEVIAQAISDECREDMARAWDEGWDERDNDCSEPYSPHKVNPYRPIPPGSPTHESAESGEGRPTGEKDAPVVHDEWCDANGCRCGTCPCLGPPWCVIPPASTGSVPVTPSAGKAGEERGE